MNDRAELLREAREWLSRHGNDTSVCGHCRAFTIIQNLLAALATPPTQEPTA